LGSNTTASDNVAVGYNALVLNTTGTQNTAIGSQALDANTTANDNVAVGFGALTANTTGAENTAVGGYGTLGYNTTGYENTAVGRIALWKNTTGHNNAAFGRSTGRDMTTGTYNTLIGTRAGEAFTTGYRNTCLGWFAGGNGLSNGYNVALGMETTFGAVNSTNEIVIGTEAVGKGSNTGFMNANSGGNYAGNNSSSWSTTSDRRIKKNIEDNNIGLEALNQIRVRNFEYRTEDEIVDFDNPKAAVVEREGLQLGVIAQEIEEILPDVVTTLESGVKTVDPDNLTWYLINAVKELSAKVEALENS
jgi:hypothetical protein